MKTHPLRETVPEKHFFFFLYFKNYHRLSNTIYISHMLYINYPASPKQMNISQGSSVMSACGPAIHQIPTRETKTHLAVQVTHAWTPPLPL